MGSHLEDMVEIANPEQPHNAVVLLLDVSGSMSQSGKIAQLTEGLTIFKNDVLKDELASIRVDLAVVTFNDQVEVIHDFSSIRDFDPPILEADGQTSMGEAIAKAIELVEQRKKQYKETGVDYFRPWIFMITDGEPTDMYPGRGDQWDNVVSMVHQGEAKKKFSFYAVGVEPANIEILSKLAPPNRPPVRLKDGRFNAMFQWLSKSQAKVSSSNPGDQIALENPVAAGWGEVTT
jgi:uncharacterized protein YegL